MSPLVIGLTGGIGAGKSTAATLLKECGANVIEVDEIGRDLLHKDGDARERIVKQFGSSILSSSGEIDRKKLGRIVFSDSGHLEQLEAISHPAINRVLKTLIGEQGSGIVILDMAILVEKQLAYFAGAPMYHKVVVVESPTGLRVNRLLQRGLSEKEIEERIGAQATDAERAQVADYVIRNSGSIEDFRRAIKNFWELIEIWRIDHTNDCMDRESGNR